MARNGASTASKGMRKKGENNLYSTGNHKIENIAMLKR